MAFSGGTAFPSVIDHGGDGGDGGWEKVWNAAADATWSGASAVDWSGLTSITINGVSFTVTRNSNWVTFGPDGSGNLRVKMSAASNYGSGTTDAPVLHATLANLLAAGGYSASRNDDYIWRYLLSSTAQDPASGNEGVGCGIRNHDGTTVSAPNDSGSIWMKISTLKIRTAINGGDYTGSSSGLRYLSSHVSQSHGFVNRFGTSAATDDPTEGTRCATFQGQSAVVDITPATPDFDVENASINCYLSGWGASGGKTFEVADLELWRLEG